MSRRPILLAVMLVVSIASLFGALLVGPFPISALQVLDSIMYPAPGVVHDVIWRLRAPRAAAAFAGGGLLALAAAAVLGLASARARRAAEIVGRGWASLCAFLLGGSVLTLADAAARWLEAPWRQVF
jgi:ABC-type Fe3+-siderophore transport system permease subunit